MAKARSKVFTRAEIIGILRETAAAYTHPHTFKPGDLVQLRSLFRDDEVPEEDVAPCIVLEVFADLGTITNEEDDKGVAGVRIARAYATNPIPDITNEHAWWFEPYTGDRPGTH